MNENNNPQSNPVDKVQIEDSTLIPIKSKTAFIAQVITSGVLVIIAGFFLVVHSWFNIMGSRGSFSYWYQTEISNLEELSKFIEGDIKNSIFMDPIEIGIWVLFPALLIAAATTFWIRKKFWTKLLIIISVLFSVFLIIGYGSNYLGSFEKTRVENRVWGKIFETLKYNNAANYTAGYSRSPVSPEAWSFLFETTDESEIIKKYYLDKGFIEKEKNLLNKSININDSNRGVYEVYFEEKKNIIKVSGSYKEEIIYNNE